MSKKWEFVHNLAENARWEEGLREIFEYRDLGIKDGTNGDYIAHIVRANGKEMRDEVQQWHVHDCTFQLVLVLNGWATFEYEGRGVRTIRKGDCILQAVEADLIAIGREALYDPNWFLHAEAALGATGEFESWPQQYGWWLTRRAKAMAKA